MQRRGLASAVAACLLLSAMSAPAQEVATEAEEGPSNRIPRSVSEILIDGVLDEPAWLAAWSVELAFEVRPAENVPPPVRTEVLATYDDHHVYFAFRAFDPDPGAIRAHLSDRDNVGDDDWVAVVLDTFNDERRAFDFLVNPLGVQSDFVEGVDGDSDGSWDAIWDSAGRITDWGYAVEMRIPFSSLRFQRSEGAQVWGFDAVRSYPRSVRHHIGAFSRDRNNNCYLCQAIKVEGFEGASPGRNLEVVPTLTSQRTDVRDELPDGDMESGGVDTELGVTASWGFTPNMTLTGTVNPDFSQVEADARQIDVNEPFAIFFAEKRPFFQEGADFFRTRLRAVYTRTIRDPSWGIKVTGKEGEHTLGAYVLQDEVTNLIFPGAESSDGTSLDMESLTTVVRYKRDVGNRFTLGALLTDREGDEYFNRVAGVDGDLRLTDRDRLQIQILASATSYPDDVAEEFDQPKGELEDWAADILYIHDTRNLDLWAGYRNMGPEFRADLGFIPQVGYEFAFFGTDYEWIPDGDTWYSRLEIGGEINRADDSEGEMLSELAHLFFTYEGPLQSHSRVGLKHSREAFAGSVFDGQQEVSLHHCMRPNGNSHFYLNLTYGDRIDYTNVRPGHRTRVEGGLRYNLGRHLKLDLDYLWQKMKTQGEELFTANIPQGTIAYQFTTRTFLRAVLQYVAYDYNVDLYTDGRDPEYRHFFTQLLFSYKVNPRTVFFLGYSENSFANQDYGLTKADRTLFVKLGYSWIP